MKEKQTTMAEWPPTGKTPFKEYIEEQMLRSHAEMYSGETASPYASEPCSIGDTAEYEKKLRAYRRWARRIKKILQNAIAVIQQKIETQAYKLEKVRRSRKERAQRLMLFEDGASLRIMAFN